MLLDGVTGSGKTEVYFEAIAECLRQGKQALVLLPEIALTEPFLKRFNSALRLRSRSPGIPTCAPRSAAAPGAAIASGEAKVTVGARSALFLPYANLGLIVVDEAHEPSFKQEEGVQYHARDVAVMRGKFEDIPVILSSATPAIETRHMVEIGRYREVTLSRALRRGEHARNPRDRPDRGPAAARPLAGAELWSPSWKPTSSAASSRCCSSTAAASRR